jgi:uncharacterized protein YuzE
MASSAVVSVKLDRDAGAAYLRLSTNSVARTVEFSEDIHVDLDAMGVVVGVELLDLTTPIPMAALTAKHHIHSDSIRILTAAVEGQATAGIASSDGNRPLHVPFGTLTRRKLASASRTRQVPSA